jgi:hypothetical protein
MSRYPRVAQASYVTKWVKARKNHPERTVDPHLCAVCGVPATHEATLQISRDRGQDIGPIKACATHSTDPYALLAAANTQETT